MGYITKTHQKIFLANNPHLSDDEAAEKLSEKSGTKVTSGRIKKLRSEGGNAPLNKTGTRYD